MLWAARLPGPDTGRRAKGPLRAPAAAPHVRHTRTVEMTAIPFWLARWPTGRNLQGMWTLERKRF